MSKWGPSLTLVAFKALQAVPKVATDTSHLKLKKMISQAKKRNLEPLRTNVEIGILSAWQLSFSKKSANGRPVLSIRSNAEVSGAEKCNLS